MARDSHVAVGILAAGKGVRLFGSSGGSKAMYELQPGVHLIDYVLDELMQLQSARVAVLVRDDDEQLCDYLSTHPAEPAIVRARSQSTGHAVVELLRAFDGNPITGIATCDIFGAEDQLASFFELAHRRLNIGDGTPHCVVAATQAHPSEDSPIWIHKSGGDVVLDYGKTIAPSSRVSASIRLMNRPFANLFVSKFHLGMTDTETMRAALMASPGSIWIVDTPSLFDVDDLESAKRAQSILRNA